MFVRWAKTMVDTETILDCGGKQSATPLSHPTGALDWPRESAVAAAPRLFIRSFDLKTRPVRAKKAPTVAGGRRLGEESITTVAGRVLGWIFKTKMTGS
jgi:hypothetical protein